MFFFLTSIAPPARSSENCLVSLKLSCRAFLIAFASSQPPIVRYGNLILWVVGYGIRRNATLIHCFVSVVQLSYIMMTTMRNACLLPALHWPTRPMCPSLFVVTNLPTTRTFVCRESCAAFLGSKIGLLFLILGLELP